MNERLRAYIETLLNKYTYATVEGNTPCANRAGDICLEGLGVGVSLKVRSESFPDESRVRSHVPDFGRFVIQNIITCAIRLNLGNSDCILNLYSLRCVNE
jgi:hypothetical protein